MIIDYMAIDLFKFFGFNLHLDILYIPLAISENGDGFWLIVKGFNSQVIMAEE